MANTKLAILALAWAVLAMGQDYTGPSVLGRKGGAVGAGRAGEPTLTFRPFISLNTSLETGSPVRTQTGPAGTAFGTIYGEDAVVGLYGGRAWRKTSLNVNYNGNFRQYTGRSLRNGSNQFLQFTVSRRLTRRLSVSLGESLSSFTGGNIYFGNPGQQTFNDRRLGAATPQNEILSGRVNSTSSLMDLTFQKSARLSFNGGADHFAVKRSGGSAGVTGNRVRGDAVYRLTRTVNVGLDYGLTQIDYTRTFGSSSIQTTRASFSKRLGRSWEASTQAGVSRVYTLGIQGVTIAPEVAAILGQSSGFEVASAVTLVPDVALRLTKTLRRSNLVLSYVRGTTPGNGLILTSRQQSFDASYNYTAVRKWHFNANTGFGGNNAIGTSQGVRDYRSKRAGGTATYQLRRFLFLNFQLGYQNFSGLGLPAIANQRNQLRTSVGLSFSPGDQPLVLR